MKACSAIVHVGPAIGAKFTQYTAEFESGGELGETPAQRFLYVLEGELKLEVAGKTSKLAARGYAFLPAGTAHRVDATKTSRVAIIEKFYQPVAEAAPPAVLISNEDAVTSRPLGDDSSLSRRRPVPCNATDDFAARPTTS